MSTPTMHGALRFLAVTAGVTLLYIALDALWFAALSPLVQRHFAQAPPDLDRRAAELAESARRSTARVGPAEQVAAWRLGHQLGLASQLVHAQVAMQGDWATRAAASVLADAAPHAERLGVGPPVPLRGRSLAEASALRQRIEDDELGIAARVERAGHGQLRHLFLTGMFAGKAAYTRVYTLLEDPQDAGDIERHARLAGLPPALWQPLARPGGATPEARREAFLQAVQAVEAALAAGGTPGRTP